MDNTCSIVKSFDVVEIGDQPAVETYLRTVLDHPTSRFAAGSEEKSNVTKLSSVSYYTKKIVDKNNVAFLLKNKSNEVTCLVLFINLGARSILKVFSNDCFPEKKLLAKILKNYISLMPDNKSVNAIDLVLPPEKTESFLSLWHLSEYFTEIQTYPLYQLPLLAKQVQQVNNHNLDTVSFQVLSSFSIEERDAWLKKIKTATKNISINLDLSSAAKFVLEYEFGEVGLLFRNNKLLGFFTFHYEVNARYKLYKNLYLDYFYICQEEYSVNAFEFLINKVEYLAWKNNCFKIFILASTNHNEILNNLLRLGYVINQVKQSWCLSFGKERDYLELLVNPFFSQSCLIYNQN